jgi:hypothetical protein
MNLRIFAVAASILALSAPAFGQTQRVPTAISPTGQSQPSTPSAIVVAPAGGVSGPGRVVALDAGLPVVCLSGCSGGGGGGGEPFAIGGNTTLTAGTTTSRVALPTTDTTVMIVNNGSVDVSFRLGNSSVNATVADGFLGAGRAIAVARGTATHVAGITASSTSPLMIMTGTGTPVIAGGGASGGGGGGGAATIADGADVTQGALADAVWSGTGSGTGQSIAKYAAQKSEAIRALLAGTLATNANVTGGSVGISGTLPAFAATPTFNIGGTLPAFAVTPAFTISGTLPAFASTPTFTMGNALPAGTNTAADVGTASFSATCTLLTLPGTGGTYAVGDLVANSATAGSVVPLTCTVGRYSGGPVTITRARVLTSTTGTSNAQFRVHVFTSAPTVTNGNDGVFLSTQAGHFCRLDTTVDQAFSDGAAGYGAPVTGTSCIRALSGTADVRVLIEARAAYAWTASQTITLALEGFN